MVDNKEEKAKVDERRSFTGSNDEVYYIANPNAESIRSADWQYSKVYTKCLNEGITTSSEMMDILKKRGIIGDDYDKRSKELSENLNELITKLYTATENKEKSELAMEVAKAREAIFQWNQRLTGPMNNTCEQIADDSRLEYLVSCMIQHEDGSRVWESYNDFLNAEDQALTMKSKYEVMLFLQGYDSNFLENTPEAVAMKEIETDLLKKADDAIAEEKEKSIEAAAADQKQEQLEDKQEPEVKKEKPNKKTTTKKKSTKKNDTKKK